MQYYFIMANKSLFIFLVSSMKAISFFTSQEVKKVLPNTETRALQVVWKTLLFKLYFYGFLSWFCGM